MPYETITPAHFLFDLVYNPPLTEFLRRGKAQGAAICNGYEMLVGQAEKAWDAIPRHSPVDFISGPRLISAPRIFSKENTGILMAM